MSNEFDKNHTLSLIEALHENGDPTSVDAAEQLQKFHNWLGDIDKPAGEWVQAQDGNYPQLKWAPEYKAAIGQKIYIAPPKKDVSAALEEIMGCFDAALIEGLLQALEETSDEHLKDLVCRRLMPILDIVQSAQETQQEESNEEDESATKEWRRLALQFDGQRMQALSLLKAMLKDAQAFTPTVKEFLAAPPLSGEEVLADRIKAMAQQKKGA